MNIPQLLQKYMPGMMVQRALVDGPTGNPPPKYPNTEDACTRMLAGLLQEIDPQRHGAFFEIGCGTFAFTFETLRPMGFYCCAVEPFPTIPLVKAQQRFIVRPHVDILKAAVADHTGKVNMYRGRMPDVSSLRPDWWGTEWGTDGVPVEVDSVSLADLLEIFPGPVNAIKIDVEGAELTIIKQIPALAEEKKPKVVMFEAGGGEAFSTRKNGWNEKFLGFTMECLRILRECGYGYGVVVPNEMQSRTFVNDERAIPEHLFAPETQYVNILLMLDDSFEAYFDRREQSRPTPGETSA